MHRIPGFFIDFLSKKHKLDIKIFKIQIMKMISEERLIA